MSNPARAKGTMAETAVVRWLRLAGFPHAERASLHGSVDQGDITGTIGLAWEVRNRAVMCLPQWLRDATSRKHARKADYGILVVKPEGIAAKDVGEWACILPLREMCELLTQAGYGTPPAIDRGGQIIGQD